MKKADIAGKERPAVRKVSLRLIVDGAHHDEIIERGIRGAKTSVWIATANLKDVHVAAQLGTRARASSRFVSLFTELLERARSGLDVRILCSGAPSRALQAKLGLGGSDLIRRCPRLHTKLVAIDGALLYLGSANFTGAGLGAKSANRRNFETGIATDCPLLLDAMQEYFDAIWSGKHCKTCQVRAHCPSPLDGLGRAPSTAKKTVRAGATLKGEQKNSSPPSTSTRR